MLIAKFDTNGVSDEISKIESQYSITFPDSTGIFCCAIMAAIPLKPNSE